MTWQHIAEPLARIIEAAARAQAQRMAADDVEQLKAENARHLRKIEHLEVALRTERVMAENSKRNSR